MELATLRSFFPVRQYHAGIEKEKQGILLGADSPPIRSTALATSLFCFCLGVSVFIKTNPTLFLFRFQLAHTGWAQSLTRKPAGKGMFLLTNRENT